ncbi:MAG: hypothetical protein PHO27_10085 [Sulfuricurvum sp.]|nr:hypothetical protein [Sulfuricurvum sp.]
MNKTLIIISANTKCLGSSLRQIFAKQFEVLCLNRIKILENNIMIDLIDEKIKNLKKIKESYLKQLQNLFEA